MPYQSAAAADAVWDYNAREQSDYLQMLTGKNQDWQLTVVQNADYTVRTDPGSSFCGNGTVSPGRTPQPGLAALRDQYQSFWFSADSSSSSPAQQMIPVDKVQGVPRFEAPPVLFLLRRAITAPAGDLIKPGKQRGRNCRTAECRRCRHVRRHALLSRYGRCRFL